MDLTHLKYFQTIASCGSMTAAAKLLKVSQPTLTVAMRNLEERLGTTLFLRERTGVRLTHTGEVLLGCAADIFATIERTEEQIRGLESEDIGSFVIGCHEHLGSYFLPDFMAGFLHEAPRIQISLWNGSSAEVERAVLDRKVHFGLVVNPDGHPDLVLVELFHDAVDFFVSTDAAPPSSVAVPRSRRGAHRNDNLEPARAAFAAAPLIFAGRVSQCQEMITRLSALGVFPQRYLPCGDFQLVKSLCVAGVGVGMMPRRIALDGEPPRLRRLHPDLPFFPDTIHLVYRADLHRTRAAMRLREALVAYGKTLDEKT